MSDEPDNDRPMTRAQLLRSGVGNVKSAGALVANTMLDQYANRFAPHVMRPPGALPELEFLVACSRCGDCAKACPANAILTLDHRAGAATGTPFLDPNKYRPCTACEDTPCITACDDAALQPLDIRDAYMGTAVVDRETCMEWLDEGKCERCTFACPFEGEAIVADEEGRPYIDPRACIGCGLCLRACPTRPRSISVKPAPRW